MFKPKDLPDLPYYQDFINHEQDIDDMRKQFQNLINEVYDFVVMLEDPNYTGNSK
jgi:hypothetical protein